MQHAAWGRVAVLAHQSNSDVIGQLVLAWAICNPISSLLDLGLSGALISDARGDFRFRDYVYLRVVTGLATLLAIVALLWQGRYGTGKTAIILAAGVVVVVESACDIFQAQLQRCEAMPWVSLSLVLRGVLGLGAFAVIHAMTGSLLLAVAGLAGAACIALFALDIPASLRYGRNNSSEHNCRTFPLIQLAWLSLPLGLATASLDLTTALPRYTICQQLGSAALGGFTVAGGLMVAISLVVGALSQAASPRLARLFAAGEIDKFLTLTGRLVIWVGVVGIASTVGMALAGKTLLYYLYGERVMRHSCIWRLCSWPLRVCVTLALSWAVRLNSMRIFRTNLLLRLVGLVLLAALLPGWIASHGIWGAAVALGLSWFVTALLAMAVVLHEAGQCKKSLQEKSPRTASGGHVVKPLFLRSIDYTPPIPRTQSGGF